MDEAGGGGVGEGGGEEGGGGEEVRVKGGDGLVPRTLHGFVKGGEGIAGGEKAGDTRGETVTGQDYLGRVVGL